MARSQQTFNKIEKEKAKRKKREEKQKRKEARKLENQETSGIPIAYVDQYGNLSETPPDPADKIKIDADDIVLGVPPKDESEEEFDPVRSGKVSFYDSSKGFGFIIDSETNEKHFCHVSGLLDDIAENDKVTFQLEKGLKGLNAVKVKQKE